jgi:hypothetical protein
MSDGSMSDSINVGKALGKSMHIYIAGPYSGSLREVKKNIKRAVFAGVEMIRRGHYPYIPHLTHYVDQLKGSKITLEWEDHLDWGLAWLDRCDALLYLGSSRGTEIELNHALNQGKLVFRSIDEVPILPSRRHYLKAVGLSSVRIAN